MVPSRKLTYYHVPNDFWVDDFPFSKAGYVGCPRGYLKQWEDWCFFGDLGPPWLRRYRSSGSVLRGVTFFSPPKLCKIWDLGAKKSWNTTRLFPRKLTWNLKNEGNPKKTSHLPGVKIFRFYVSLWGCTWFFRSGFLFRVGFFRVERLDSLGNLMVLKVTRIHEQKFRPEIPQEMKSLNEQLAKEGRTRLPEYVFFFAGYGWIFVPWMKHKTQVVEAVGCCRVFPSNFWQRVRNEVLCVFAKQFSVCYLEDHPLNGVIPLPNGLNGL